MPFDTSKFHFPVLKIAVYFFKERHNILKSNIQNPKGTLCHGTLIKRIINLAL